MTKLGDGDDEKQYRSLPKTGKYYNRTTELKGRLKKRLPCKDGVGPEKEENGNQGRIEGNLARVIANKSTPVFTLPAFELIGREAKVKGKRRNETRNDRQSRELDAICIHQVMYVCTYTRGYWTCDEQSKMEAVMGMDHRSELDEHGCH